jgi:hypothetical protein
VFTELTNLIATEIPAIANMLPETVIETEPEDGMFVEVTLETIIWEYDKTKEIEDSCLFAETDTAIFAPEPAETLQVNKESDVQKDPEQLEKLMRTEEEGVPNPFPDIAARLLPVVGTILMDITLAIGFK